ncbi:MAG: hypothetical protein QOE70_5561 [Chthoniobacter sp.]|nr:hypothetical protein [Chthoniobacter sp.]
MGEPVRASPLNELPRRHERPRRKMRRSAGRMARHTREGVTTRSGYILSVQERRFGIFEFFFPAPVAALLDELPRGGKVGFGRRPRIFVLFNPRSAEAGNRGGWRTGEPIPNPQSKEPGTEAGRRAAARANPFRREFGTDVSPRSASGSLTGFAARRSRNQTRRQMKTQRTLRTQRAAEEEQRSRNFVEF